MWPVCPMRNVVRFFVVNVRLRRCLLYFDLALLRLSLALVLQPLLCGVPHVAAGGCHRGPEPQRHGGEQEQDHVTRTLRPHAGVESDEEPPYTYRRCPEHQRNGGEQEQNHVTRTLRPHAGVSDDEPPYQYR